jgi:LPS export ABC transporter permease LptG/LPS export ABC transporter permease LptF
VRLLGRYIFREILTGSVLGTMLATFIIFLRQSDKLFEVLVGSSNVPPATVLTLFAWGIPPQLPFTIPFGVLVGILIGLGRLSSDSEIVAMRAAGVSSRIVILPVLLFATIGVGLAAFASLRLSPLAFRESTRIVNDLLATRLSAEIEPRVFDEDFPNHILYVGDVVPGPVASKWLHVFIADVTPPEKRTSGMKEKAWGPMITVAPLAIATSDVKHNRIQLDMSDASTHEMGRDLVANDQVSKHSQQVLDASPPEQKSLSSQAVSTRQLLTYHGPDWLEYKIELHKRFALPVACFVLAMVGIPLGISTRKGGKSAAYVYAIFLAFFCYYLSFMTLSSIAREQKVPAYALWLPDVVIGLAGLIFLTRMELPGDGDLLRGLTGVFARIRSSFKFKTTVSAERRLPAWRLPLLPQIIDTYFLSSFLFYLAVWLAAFVSLFQIFTFFDLMGDMVRNHIPLIIMFEYLFFLTPLLIYQMLPISVLVAALVTLGILSKQNEITAFKACGVSLYRMTLPIVAGAILLSGTLFAFDYYYVPGANRRQEDLRDKIKNRKQQSWQRPDRKWIMFPDGSRIYYYKYFDTTEKMMVDVNMFELDPATFEVKHEIVADRARWIPDLKPAPAWVFENGWSAVFKDKVGKSTKFQFASYPELTEPPESFLREVPPDKQMNFMQLDRYITDLKRSGISTIKLQVQLYRKFSVPLFALIMAMIAVPFGFMVGNRGAMTAIGVSIAIGVIYLGLDKLAEKVGDVSLLTPKLAAWTPDMVFALAGLFLLMRMKS